jgi:hypothetical protein
VPESISNSGNAQAIFQVGIKLDSSRIDEFNFTSNSESGKSLYQETVNEPAWTNTLISTYDSSFVNRLLEAVMATGDPDVLVRYGLGSGGNYKWIPWQEHTITEFSAIPQSIGDKDGFQVKLSTSDRAARIDRARKTKAHSGKVSDIVRKIAADNGFDKTVIEPTTGVVNMIQSYESDVSFVLRRLAPRAINLKGRGAYRFYLKDNVFHFHTVDYQSSVRSLDYFFQSSAYTIIQTDQSQAKVRSGAARVRAILYNPLTGELRDIVSSPDKILRFGNSTPNFEDIDDIEQNLLIHVGHNLEVDAENYIQSTYEEEHSQMYELMLMTTKTPSLRINDLINVNLSPQPGKWSPWSGLYCVASCKHVLEQGNLVSSFVLQRGELNKPRSNFNDLNELDSNAVRGSFDAPGQAVNLKSVDSSRFTTGAESGRIKTVLNPSTEQPV